MDSKGYYKTLGVGEKASQDEIKKAFRKLSIKYHPDKQNGKTDKEKKEAETKFKEINEAYQVLSDETKRAQYDRGGSFDFGNMGGSGASGWGGGFDFGGMDFDQFGFDPTSGFDFSTFFGGSSNSRQAKPKVENGSDIRMTIPISIEDIFTGCTKKVKYTRNIRCKVCHGAGGTNQHTCPECNGTGLKRYRTKSVFGMSETVATCPKCGGRGYAVDTKCPHCNGTGLEKEEVVLDVSFMPGMYDGFAIQYAGKGNESMDTRGKNGDFLAVCKHSYDTSRYTVNSVDIYEKIEIPYYDALLGCEYILEKPDHTKRKIRIPSCVPNGKQLKLMNQGIKHGNTYGDYYIIVNYKFPEKLSVEELKALEVIKYEMDKVKKE